MGLTPVTQPSLRASARFNRVSWQYRVHLAGAIALQKCGSKVRLRLKSAAELSRNYAAMRVSVAVNWLKCGDFSPQPHVLGRFSRTFSHVIVMPFLPTLAIDALTENAVEPPTLPTLNRSISVPIDAPKCP